jgi:4-hydroxy-tetrahydrodipicolinate reductase
VIRVAVAGASGRTGAPVCDALAREPDIEVVARAAPSLAGRAGCYASLSDALVGARPDVVVDFTRPDLVEAHVAGCLGAGVPLVLGTSGLDADARGRLDTAARAAGVAVFWAANYALTAVAMMRLAELAARLFPRVEIVELHDERKLDAPSATAAVTAERVAAVTGTAAPPIHSVRLPGLVAHQEVLFGERGQLLTIRHDAYSREAFAPGVVLAVRRMGGLAPGLTVGLEALLDLAG